VSLFAALFPPEAAIAHLSTVVGGLGLERFGDPAKWHVTVAFLGEADEAAARRAMQVAQLLAVGELRLEGAGQFGESVFWAGLGGDLDGLGRLNRTVRRAMRAQRVSPDDRQYRPHLTISRPRAVVPPAALETMRRYQGPSWPVEEVVLVRSDGAPGFAYHRLGTWPVPSR
jgi:2'-5' RNA ligase